MSQSAEPAEGPYPSPSEPLDESSTPSTTESADGEVATPGIAAEISTALSGLADLPVDQHPEVYEDIHRRLGDNLSGIDHV